MNINLECIYCTINKADSLFSEHETDESKKIEFMKKVFKIVSMSKIEDTPPLLAARIMRVLNSTLQQDDIYFKIKKEYNNLLISMESDIMNIIHDSNDKLLTALKFAMVGNFIDFGAMDKVDTNELNGIIHQAPKQLIDRGIYDAFLKELKNGGHLAYLADNAGEIVLDKIFIKVIKKLYPGIKIDLIVRGKPIYNDATIVDAQEIGLCNLVDVVDNGTDIPGTDLGKINAESKDIIENADLIIAKGQGNFETLFGCGKNIYYVFLCKCDLFTRRFDLEKFRGIFANEKNVKDLMA